MALFKYLKLLVFILTIIDWINSHRVDFLEEHIMLIKNNTCPSFSCQSEYNVNCAYSQNIGSNNVNVVIVDNICLYDEFCSFNISNIYRPTEQSFTCEKKNTQVDKISYPGEDCSTDYSCMPVIDFGTCESGNQCSGLNVNEFCKENIQCKAGTYCSDEKKCTPQKSVGESCNSLYDCKNNLVCWDKKCIEVNSLPLGFTGDILSCKYGSVSEGECDLFRSLDSPGQDFIRCNPNEDCHYQYINSKQNFTLKCECGYNKEGSAYCPISHFTNENKWEELFDTLKDLLDNDCHTLNRFNCQKVRDNIDYYTYLSTQTIQAHKFYNSVECAHEFLGIKFPNSLPAVIIFIIIASVIIVLAIIGFLIYYFRKRTRNVTEPLIQTRVSLDNACQICFANSNSRKINCGSHIVHELCNDCYTKLIVTERTRKCPFCRNDIKY